MQGRRGYPGFQIRNQADSQDMADLPRNEMAREAGHKQAVRGQHFGHGQAQIGDRPFLLVRKGVEGRRLSGKRLVDLVRRQTGKRTGGRYHILVPDQPAPGPVDQLPQDILLIAVASTKQGNHRHRGPLLPGVGVADSIRFAVDNPVLWHRGGRLHAPPR